VYGIYNPKTKRTINILTLWSSSSIVDSIQQMLFSFVDTLLVTHIDNNLSSILDDIYIILLRRIVYVLLLLHTLCSHSISIYIDIANLLINRLNLINLL